MCIPFSQTLDGPFEGAAALGRMGSRVTQSSPGTNPIVMFYDAGGQLLEQDISSSGLALQGQYVWSAGAGYQNALVLRDFAFSGSGFTLNERTYALQDANWNVTALVGYSTLPGDTNANGTVDFSDLVRLEQYYDHYAAGGSAVGDFNHDGYVDFNDLLTLLQHDNTSSTFSSWTVFERISYSPYGVMSTYTPTFTANSDFLAWNVGFEGMLYDAQTGFNYTLSRVYEASTGRFLTVDPAHADGMNWFRGFGDNPVNSLDPTGMNKKRDPQLEFDVLPLLTSPDEDKFDEGMIALAGQTEALEDVYDFFNSYGGNWEGANFESSFAENVAGAVSEGEKEYLSSIVELDFAKPDAKDMAKLAKKLKFNPDTTGWHLWVRVTYQEEEERSCFNPIRYIAGKTYWVTKSTAWQLFGGTENSANQMENHVSSVGGATYDSQGAAFKAASDDTGQVLEDWEAANATDLE